MPRGSESSVRRVVILGAGGHAREQLDLVAALNETGRRYDVLGFIVDAEYAKPGQIVRGLSVLGGLEWIAEHSGEVEVVCAVGEPRHRYRIVERARAVSARFCTLVHPSAQVAASVHLDEGVIVCAGAVLTSDVEIGAHVHINIGCTVSHDCVLAPCSSLAPGVHLAGYVRVGEGCHLGVGSSVIDRCEIGEWSITGAGSVVISDLPANSTAGGVPARVIKSRPAGWHLETVDAGPAI